jgi:hypothetical protein
MLSKDRKHLTDLFQANVTVIPTVTVRETAIALKVAHLQKAQHLRVHCGAVQGTSPS